jgi:hypothetical protein
MMPPTAFGPAHGLAHAKFCLSLAKADGRSISRPLRRLNRDVAIKIFRMDLRPERGARVQCEPETYSIEAVLHSLFGVERFGMMPAKSVTSPHRA